MISRNGLMPAVVTRVDDPEKCGRVKASIPDLLADPQTGEILESPWCEAKGAWGPGAGGLNVPPVGSHIWVQTRFCSNGDVYQLIYEPGRFGSTGSEAHTPAVGKGADDETVELKAGIPFKIPAPDTRLEMPDARGIALDVVRTGKQESIEIPGVPSSANAGEYPNNRVLKTSSGILLELDDTPGAPRVHIWHPEGTYIEINGKGVLTQRQTKRWEETLETDTRHIGGNEQVAVDGHELRRVSRNSIEDIKGRKVILAGDMDIQSRLNLMMEVAGNLIQDIGGRSLETYGTGRSVTVGGEMSAQWLGKGSFTSFGSTSFLCMQALRANAAMGMSFSCPVPWLAAAGGIRFGAAPGAPTATPLALAGPLLTVLEALLLHADTHIHTDSKAGPTTPALAPEGLLAAATAIPLGLVSTKILAGE